MLVVCDRNVIDQQLQDAIFDFERTAGVVATIKGEGASKSSELAEALSGAKKIVVCTIQTFPFALEGCPGTGSDQGQTLRGDRRRGAQLADWRGSRQAEGRAHRRGIEGVGRRWRSQHRRRAAGADGRSDRHDRHHLCRVHGDPQGEDAGVVWPRPQPDQPAGPENLPAPFHVYSMRQAIEEGFILDVLQNYTTYKLAFKLAHDGKEMDEQRSSAARP